MSEKKGAVEERFGMRDIKPEERWGGNEKLGVWAL
jgi:hypothetical protein